MSASACNVEVPLQELDHVASLVSASEDMEEGMSLPAKTRTALLTLMMAAACLGTLVLASGTTVGPDGQRSARFLQSSTTLSEEMQEVLDKHNVYRCMHGVPLLSWDADIAANAQAWADKGVYAHSPWEDRIVNGQGCGENMAWGGPTRTGTHSTIAWYSEIEHTSPYGLATAFSMDTGHYTQLVWKSTTKLGCGKGRANGGDLWVCQYGPSGNYGGQFGANVLAPVETVETCGGSASDVPTPLTTTATTTATTITTATTTTGPQCEYVAFSNTAVKNQGTGGSKLKRVSYASDAAYLAACKVNCNADSRCDGFVDDPTDRRGRMCKPKTASAGYGKALKTFYRKGSEC